MDGQVIERRTMRLVGRRLLPFLFILFVLNFLDRTNVGIAALQMNDELKFSPAVFGFGAGIFFLGYALFEVPSNLVLARVGARRWLARIMITWGIIASAMMFVRTPLQFYILRFLLGVAEAGFFRESFITFRFGFHRRTEHGRPHDLQWQYLSHRRSVGRLAEAFSGSPELGTSPGGNGCFFWKVCRQCYSESSLSSI